MSATCIPGTNYPLPVFERKGPPPLRNEREAKQRRGLLAKVHIAKKQLGLNSGEYEMILRGFKAASAGDLPIPELEKLVKLLKHYGFRPVKVGGRSVDESPEQLDALRKRVAEVAGGITDGARRLPGLTKKFCGVVPLPWCRDAQKLRRLLACLQKIKEKES